MRMHMMMAMMVGVGALLVQSVAGFAEDNAAYYQNVTVMNLDAEARRTVTQDRVSVNLNIQRDGKTAAEAQAAVNAKMQAALAKKVPSVKATTGYYNVYKQYPPETGPRPLTPKEREKTAYWTAQQTLVLDGADKDAVLKLAGTLQENDFAMQGMNFYLSREAQDKVKEDLLAEALASVKARAQKVADIMGNKSIHFARMNVGGAAPSYPPVMMMKAARMEMADTAMPAPVGEAGESDVTLSVNVEVHLK